MAVPDSRSGGQSRRSADEKAGLLSGEPVFQCQKKFEFKVAGTLHAVQVEHKEGQWRVMVGEEIVQTQKHGSTNPLSRKEHIFELPIKTEVGLVQGTLRVSWIPTKVRWSYELKVCDVIVPWVPVDVLAETEKTSGRSDPPEVDPNHRDKVGIHAKMIGPGEEVDPNPNIEGNLDVHAKSHEDASSGAGLAASHRAMPEARTATPTACTGALEESSCVKQVEFCEPDCGQAEPEPQMKAELLQKVGVYTHAGSTEGCAREAHMAVATRAGADETSTITAEAASSYTHAAEAVTASQAPVSGPATLPDYFEPSPAALSPPHDLESPNHREELDGQSTGHISPQPPDRKEKPDGCGRLQKDTCKDPGCVVS